MKRLFTVVVLVVFGVMTAFAQNDPKAKQVLDDLLKKYKSFDSFKADFEVILEGGGNKETRTGDIVVKGNKYYADLEDMEIFNNGETVWNYSKDPDFPEVLINDYDPETEEFSIMNIYNIPQNDFKYIHMGVTNGLDIIELEPLDRESKTFFKIRLFVDQDTDLLQTMKVFEKSGINMTYNINNFQKNYSCTDGLFELDSKEIAKLKSEGVEVVDMRM